MKRKVCFQIQQDLVQNEISTLHPLEFHYHSEFSYIEYILFVAMSYAPTCDI